ncbi:hypothetical protein FHR32_005777 [Streptosporangium album]|uniref:TPM domain-containing protein n=1 Tax=Streptosporangium album TaxID=47479 RepID=A0A7W7WCJ7_9ACTN|nr:TPM domain-containing protein [Streptosporangium album]MBB4941400.1 hypothetical protein [Streptosporangium album]
MLHLVRVLAVLVLTMSPGGPATRADRPAAVRVTQVALSPWGAAADPPAVAADPPAVVSGQVTDRAGVLGARRAEVEAAVAELRARRGVRLYVVYVESFSGLNATDWVAVTARLSDLGRLDLLLAIDTADGRYAVFADQTFPLSDAQLDSVAATTIEPELRHVDWAGAPIVAAEEYDTALASLSVVSAAGPLHPGGRRQAGGAGSADQPYRANLDGALQLDTSWFRDAAPGTARLRPSALGVVSTPEPPDASSRCMRSH